MPRTRQFSPFTNDFTGESVTSDEYAGMGGTTNNYDPRGWFDKVLQWAPVALSGGAALASLGGAGAASGAGAAGSGAGAGAGTVTAGIPAGSSIGTSLAGPGITSAATGASMGSGAGGIFGFLGKMKAAGLDPTILGLGGLQALLGDDQELESYSDAPYPQNQLVDPVQALYNVLAASDRMGSALQDRIKRGATLRSSFVQPPPDPIAIPGLPFQIGGGLGRDPALDHPELLNNADPGQYYQSLLPGGKARRRVGGQ